MSKIKVENMEKGKSPLFQLGTTFRRIDDIRALDLNGLGCWAEIWLYGEAKPRAIGDGSYEGCPRHVRHEVVWLSDGSPDFSFRNLRKLIENEQAKSEEVIDVKEESI